MNDAEFERIVVCSLLCFGAMSYSGFRRVRLAVSRRTGASESQPLPTGKAFPLPQWAMSRTWRHGHEFVGSCIVSCLAAVLCTCVSKGNYWDIITRSPAHTLDPKAAVERQSK